MRSLRSKGSKPHEMPLLGAVLSMLLLCMLGFVQPALPRLPSGATNVGQIPAMQTLARHEQCSQATFRTRLLCWKLQLAAVVLDAEMEELGRYVSLRIDGPPPCNNV